jgi:hypothetical protein
MKKVKVILPALALSFAVIGAWASVTSVAQDAYYKNTTVTPNTCTKIGTCTGVGPAQCSTTAVVGSLPIGTPVYQQTCLQRALGTWN